MQEAERLLRQQATDAAKEKRLVKHGRQKSTAAPLDAKDEDVEDMPLAQRVRKQSGSRQVPY